MPQPARRVKATPYCGAPAGCGCSSTRSPTALAIFETVAKLAAMSFAVAM
jgi:hypothetical protein